jgi:chloramphenicol 3-O phosphotransferase
MIIFLNGTSSSGKTTAARQLQELSADYVLNFSIDQILYALPPTALKRMTTGLKNPGLNFLKLEKGFYRCVRALADLDHKQIVDTAITSRESAREMVEAWDGVTVLMVGLICDAKVLEKRETARADRAKGEAVSQLSKIHSYCKYDLLLDSAVLTPVEIASSILKFVDSESPLHGFNKTKEFLKTELD